MSNLLKNHKELMKEYNFEKNKDIDLNTVTCGSNKKVWWICQKGHSYDQYINLKVKGGICPICSNHRVLKGYNDITSTNPELLKEWDYKKNSLTPEEVTNGSGKKVWWICLKCKSSYEATISSRSSGMGCPYCAGKKVKIGFNDLKTWCEKNNRNDLINEFDKAKNDFDITSITVGSGKKIWFLCPNGHSYQTTLNSRINNGTGCGICSHKVFRKGENDLLTTHPDIAKEWDYAKNKVKPDEVMAGSIKKYWFICPKGHSYSTSLANRKKGQGCPKCNVEKHTSFPEKAITFYLKKIFKEVEESYHNSFLGTKEIDIYLPELKFGVEYDGVAWHKNYKRDLEKDKECSKNDITLLRIREIGCKEYNSNSIKKYIAVHSIQELNNAIIFIFDCLNKKYKLHLKVDVDVDRDRIKIMELMNLTEKNNSIEKYCPEICKYWDYEKNGRITPDQISHSSVKKIFLKCSKGHEWESCAHNFYNAPYCPICSGFMTLKGYNDLFTTNPELKSQWSTKNKIDPTTIRKGSNKKALWFCAKCGYEYEMVIQDKALGRQCPYCTNSRIKIGYNDLKTTNPELIREWDYDKNTIKPEEVMKGSNKKIWWKCSICNNEWETKIYNRAVLHRGCPKCAVKKQVDSFKANQLAKKGSLKENNPELLEEWDYKKNKLSPEMVTSGSNEKVWWKCSKCGYEWKTSVNNRTISNTECPKCAIKKVASSKAKKVQQFSMDGKLIAEYNSASEAIRKTGIINVHSACRGKYKSSGGYIWKYKE